MQREFEGKRVASGLYIGIVVSRFNEMITGRLLDGALDAFKRHSVGEEGNVDIFWVPGSFELPMTAKRLVESNKYDAVVALGALIRGETDHYEILARVAAKGLAQIAIKSKIPLSFGLVTADTIEQALSRAGMKHGNKGFDAMVSVIETVSLYHQITEAEGK